ncbi:potassium two pore domain channel subfamily K member galene [Cotesia typhae]|uniref:potassium two pore domain channel subfamily K member galene n=1 Tax=Cotesia typhae TaxID=2053667 RepID=UPI003D693895
MDSTEMDVEFETPSKCLILLCLIWKFFKCIFSHVTLVSLVVAYCVLGAWAFERLESGHEKDVKRSIKNIRGNVTEKLWIMTQSAEILIRKNWTDDVVEKLRAFETDLLKKMKKDGWDGSEEEDNIQWTFAGALFYSIIVITTIGYGHISPKTPNGKVVTIFYAILGIPLMLLCLSNIGDVMASSFRFLYWKICCYICTRPPKPRRVRSSYLARGYSVRQGSGRAGSRPASLRRSVRASHKSTDSALGNSGSMPRSTHSETVVATGEAHRFNPPRRYDVDGNFNDFTKRSTLASSSGLPRQHHLQSISPTKHTYELPSTSTTPRIITTNSRLSRSGTATSHNVPGATQSLDRRLLFAPNYVDDRTPVFFNKYAIDDPLPAVPRHHHNYTDPENQNSLYDDVNPSRPSIVTKNRLKPDNLAFSTLPRVERSVITPRRCCSVDPSVVASEPSPYLEVSRPRRAVPTTGSSIRRPRSNLSTISRTARREAPSPRIMSPMGFAVHRQTYADDIEYDEYYMPVEDQTTKPVPIWLCVFLVVSYILGGAVLFNEWESWIFLDSAYFCFITLTTIGFGDFVPAHRLHAHQGIALCSLYLLFGIALLAMSFNLVQEEVITNVKSVAKRLGIIKEDEDDEDDAIDDDFDVVNDDYDDGNASEYVDYHPSNHRGYSYSHHDLEMS